MEISKRSQRLLPPPFRRTPWLVFPHGKGMRNQIFCSITDQRSYIRSIPEMRRKFCWASCYGWLVMCDRSCSHFYIWNPVSLDKIQLPPLSLKSMRYNCTLSSPPRDPNCRVFFFGNLDPFIFHCRPGDDEWIKEECVVGEDKDKDKDKDKDDGIRIAIRCNDKLYGLTYGRLRLVEMSIVADCVSTRVLEIEVPDFIPERPRFSSHLLESCGELFLVRIYYLLMDDVLDVGAIQVFRMDSSRMVWVKVENLEDRVFFLCRKSPFSCSATQLGLRRGNIYFNVGDGKVVFVFNVEDGSVSVSLPCSNLPTPWVFPTWVMPDLSLIDRRAEIVEEDDEGEMQNMKAKEIEGVEKHGDGDERHWSDLPTSILTSIVQRFHPVDYLYFRGTCRDFRLLAPSIKWRMDSIGSEMDSLFPWLMFFMKDNGICNFIEPWHNDTYCMNISELLLGAIIRCSKDGWLLMTRDKLSIFFFNPFTRAIIHLPDLSEECCQLGFTFSSLPTSSDCIVFGISYWDICFIRKGEVDWNYFSIDYKVFSLYDNNPVFYNEGFYCLGKEGELGIFVIKNEEASWTVLDKPRKPCTSIYHTFLAECDGELLSVFMGHMGKFARVFRLNRSKMAWIEVKSLGNHMLFVSHSSSISAKAKTPEMENKIYFSRFRRESIVFYSLETGMYHSFGSEHSTSDFYDLKERLHCGWIEPRWFKSTEEELNWFSDSDIDTL